MPTRMNEQSVGSGAGATFATEPPRQRQAMSLGTRRDHLMGAGRDESQEVSASPRGSQQTSKKQNCTGGKGEDCGNPARVPTPPAELHARSKRKGQALAIGLE